jgi:hypothetical protein
MLLSSCFFYLVNVSFKASRSSSEYLACTLRASGVLENIKHLPFRRIIDFDGSSFEGGRGRIFIEQVGEDIYLILLEYNWKDNRRPINLVTLRSRY